MSFCLITSLVIITMTISCTSVAPVSKSGMNNGTETVYFDDWEKCEAIHKKHTTKMMGIDLERNFMTLMTENGKWVYNIDLNSKTAIKMNNNGFKALFRR